MICRSCGLLVEDHDSICPNCHSLLRDSPTVAEDPLTAYRQGKRGQTPPEAPATTRRRRRSVDYAEEPVVTEAVPDRSQPYELPSWEEQSPPVEEDYDGYEVYKEYVPSEGEVDLQKESAALEMEDVIPPSRTARYGYTQAQNAIPVSPDSQQKLQKLTNRPMVNWVKVWIMIIGVVILAAAGVGIYLNTTPQGQRILARFGGSVPSLALWEVGEERLDTGDIDGAIRDFETARQMDGEDLVNVDGLLLLGGAYEAAGRVEDAENLYRDIYTTVTRTRPEAYRHVIRLLIASGRRAEAADLMQFAYEMTGLAAFRQQREEFIPKPPEANPIAGFYEQVKKLTLISTEGYDVYYSPDLNAQLPGDGILYTEPIILNEGNHDLRAVAVNGDLVSDLWSGNYRIIKPSPQTPQSNLAPNTYKKRHKVRLRPGKENEKDTDITIYYTIDGAIPDANSPIYTGEPIEMPGGRVTLKAVAVNGDSKASNMLEITYKFDEKPYPLAAYTNQDEFRPFVLQTTTREEFFAKFGEGEAAGEEMLDRYETPCLKYTYPWGHVLMYKTPGSWVLVQVSVINQEYTAPRNTQVGMSLDEVITKYRDMGQLPGAKGHRGLYEMGDNSGKVIPQPDGTSVVEYVTNSNQGFKLKLEYVGDGSGRVQEIRYTAVPL